MSPLPFVPTANKNRIRSRRFRRTRTHCSASPLVRFSKKTVRCRGTIFNHMNSSSCIPLSCHPLLLLLSSLQCQHPHPYYPIPYRQSQIKRRKRRLLYRPSLLFHETHQHHTFNPIGKVGCVLSREYKRPRRVMNHRLKITITGIGNGEEELSGRRDGSLFTRVLLIFARVQTFVISLLLYSPYSFYLGSESNAYPSLLSHGFPRSRIPPPF
jgi:hypothetical protein